MKRKTQISATLLQIPVLTTVMLGAVVTALFRRILAVSRVLPETYQDVPEFL
jgi:hypothetical protein